MMNTFRLTYSNPDDARLMMSLLLTERYAEGLAWVTNNGEYELGLLGDALVLRVPRPEETDWLPDWIPAWDVAGEVARKLNRVIGRDDDPCEAEVAGILEGLG
ncbi:hypothetical protein F8M49_17255 [Rhodococcus zopfii]|uniref:Uncharacterized protein n=1 Tax=Rhodococcus zopfii TaxID=43772 RepID=A0ABU3WRL7_9NOCA|nr:hypothetical protein [Rhodococcus zopfii]